MKHLLATTLLSLVCCVANAEADKVISVLCNGVKLDSFFDSPKPITTTYFFKFEKNPKNKNVVEWSMQENGERTRRQERISDNPLLISFAILVSDHSVLLNDVFINKAVVAEKESKINRLSGDWLIQYTEYKKNDDGMREITRTANTAGTCEAANPKF